MILIILLSLLPTFLRVDQPVDTTVGVAAPIGWIVQQELPAYPIYFIVSQSSNLPGHLGGQVQVFLGVSFGHVGFRMT